jgi:hypothetical protein
MRLLLPTVVAAAALAVAAPSAAASCAFLSSANQEARADIIVEGTILEAEPGTARLAVERRVKGDPPDELEVIGAGPGVATSVDILPRAGERWRILGQDAGPATVSSSICEGSVRLDGPASDAPGQRVEPPPAPSEDSLADGLLGWIAALLALLGEEELLTP